MNLQQWQAAQDSPEVLVNENFEVLGHVAVYGKDASTSTGLTWGYLGGRWSGFAVSAGTLVLAAGSTLYLTVSRVTGVLSASASDAAWVNLAEYARVYKIVTGSATVTAVEDHRAGLGGVHGISYVGSEGVGVAPVVSDGTASRAIAAVDKGAYLRFTSAGAKVVTFAAEVGFVAGDEVHIANRASSGDVTLFGTGITLMAPKGGVLVLEPGDTVTVKFVGSNVADVFGSTKVAA